MPYIGPNRQKEITASIVFDIKTPGELNFFFTKVAMEYLLHKGPLTYQLINDVMGALEGTKQEFYRRVAVPYEEQKIVENGDLYVPILTRHGLYNPPAGGCGSCSIGG